MKRHSKLKGTVLFTVISVMSLLIIFLTSTLVLATSASNRAHKNYSSSQTEYTSRTAIESVLNAIKVDNTFADAVCNVSSTSGSLSVPVEFKSTSTNLNSMGKVDNVIVEYAGTKDYFNPVTNAWETKDLLKLTASVTLGGQNSVGQTSTTSAYLVKDPPKPDGGGGGGAGFVTTGGATLANHSNIFGGSYLNVPSLAEAQTYNYLDVSKNYLSHENFSLGNGQVVEADFVVNGNLNLSQDAVFVIPYQKTGITVWGDFNVVQQLKVYIETENCSSPYDNFNQIPYFYIDGTLKSNSGININNSVEMNLFCGNIEAQGNEFLATADMYCMDASKSNLISTNNSTLSSWTASVINKTNGQNGSYVAGNLFSKGNLNLGNKVTINGDVRAEGDVTISGEVTIKGDLVVGGTLVKSGNLNVDGNIYARNAVGFATSTELKENVIQVANIYHSAEEKIKDGYTKVNNAFYAYEYKDFEYVETRYGWQKIYKDLNGNLTDKPGAYFDINGKEYNDWELKNVYSDEGKRGYYVMLDEEGNHLRKSDVISSLKVENPHWLNHFNNDDLVITEDKFYIYDSTGKYIASNETWNYMETVPEYYTIADISGADTGIKTPDSYSYYLQISPTEYNLISAEEAFKASGVLPVSSFTGDIYPEYAEKDVILGLRQLNDYSSGKPLDIKETQVVKTMEDILNNVVNPYKYSGVPTKFETAIQNLRNSGEIIDDVNELRNYMETVATNLYDADSNVNIQYETYDPSIHNKSYPVINKTCILNIDGIDASYFPNSGKRALIINPGSSEICVVIDKLNLASGTQIIVDDSQGGTVHIYVNGGLVFDEQLITTSYLQLQEDMSDFQIYTNENCKMDGINSVEPPKVYVYGATGSTIHIQNMKGIAAFVLAPETKFSFGNASSSLWKNSQTIYYNKYKAHGPGVSHSNLKNLSVIGCLNVAEANLGNDNITLYLPDKESSAPIPTPDKTHWFKILSYDEY